MFTNKSLLDEMNDDGTIIITTTRFGEGGREILNTDWKVSIVEDNGDYLVLSMEAIRSDIPALVDETMEFEADSDIEFDDLENTVSMLQTEAF